MFDKYEVIRRMLDGESFEDIAAEFTEALYESKAMFDDAVERNEKKDKQVEDMREIVDLIHDYLIEYHTYCDEDIDTIHKMFSDLDIEDIVDEFSAMYEQFQKLSENIKIVPSLVKIGDVLSVASETKARPEKKVKFVSLDDADGIITDFINQLK